MCCQLSSEFKTAYIYNLYLILFISGCNKKYSRFLYPLWYQLLSLRRLLSVVSVFAFCALVTLYMTGGGWSWWWCRSRNQKEMVNSSNEVIVMAEGVFQLLTFSWLILVDKLCFETCRIIISLRRSWYPCEENYGIDYYEFSDVNQ